MGLRKVYFFSIAFANISTDYRTVANKQIPTSSTFIDIVVITENRSELLKSTLLSLEHAAFGRDIRLLVGFNGSTDQFVSEAGNMIDSIQFKSGILMTRFEKKWPGSARNHLIELSDAEWIFFCDDDVLVPSDIFENFTNLQKQFQELKAFGGPNLTPPGSSVIERAQGYALGLRLVAGPMSHRYQQSKYPDTRLVYNAFGLTLCNLFWKKTSMTYFPEQFICGEELHLLKMTPGPYIYSTLLSVFHYRRTSWSAFFQQTVKYGIGRSQQSPVAIVLAWLLLVGFSTALIYFPFIVGMGVVSFSFLLGVEILKSIKLKNKEYYLMGKIIRAAITVWSGYGLGILFGFLKNRQIEKSLVYERT